MPLLSSTTVRAGSPPVISYPLPSVAETAVAQPNGASGITFTPATDSGAETERSNEGRQQYSAADIRFNKKGDKTLYVTLFGVPEDDVTVKALGSKTGQNSRKIKSISLLGSDEAVAWTQTKDALTIAKPAAVPTPEAVVYKVTFR